jgi:YbbR domain-containing protein
MWLRDLFYRNLGLKFLSLVAALILWFMAVGREKAEVGLTVPLEFTNIPANMVIANQVPDGISVRIRGSVALTRQIERRRLRFSLDLVEGSEGVNHFTLTPETLGLPRDIEVTRMAPNSITVELEGIENKKFGLLPVIKGEPLPGFMIEDINLEPKSLELRGPKSILEGVNILWTEPIDVTRLDKTSTLTVQPSLPDMSLSVVGNKEIKAHLKISEKLNTRAFQAVPVEAINTDLNFKLDPETVAVTVRGPLSTMKTLASGKAMHIRVNLAGLKPGEYEKKVVVTIPPDAELISIDPDTIKIEINNHVPGGGNE